MARGGKHGHHESSGGPQGLHPLPRLRLHLRRARALQRRVDRGASGLVRAARRRAGARRVPRLRGHLLRSIHLRAAPPRLGLWEGLLQLQGVEVESVRHVPCGHAGRGGDRGRHSGRRQGHRAVGQSEELEHHSAAAHLEAHSGHAAYAGVPVDQRAPDARHVHLWLHPLAHLGGAAAVRDDVRGGRLPHPGGVAPPPGRPPQAEHIRRPGRVLGLAGQIHLDPFHVGDGRRRLGRRSGAPHGRHLDFHRPRLHALYRLFPVVHAQCNHWCLRGVSVDDGQSRQRELDGQPCSAPLRQGRLRQEWLH
mmetsp:Transcript_127832/g.368090  ORF Transcript_127832/g.368090 Transcript_127832/m.368090 type:complete len:307 (-) Transcript_127832:423-1343(-)